MRWIYLSPHLDDAVLSCGGLIWEQVRAGDRVEVWTICAGNPPKQAYSAFAEELHTRWALSAEAAVAERRAEDERAVSLLGAVYRHFSLTDAVYRLHPKTGEHLYPDWETILAGLHPGDEMYLRRMVFEMADILADGLGEDVALAAPLTLGNHVDHLFTRGLAEMLRLPLCYYPDYPYAIEYEAEAAFLAPAGAEAKVYPVSAQGLAAWQDSVAAYTSQISTFWDSDKAMRAAIRSFCERGGGVRLWVVPLS